jgi:HK97 family phage portal protein
LQGSRRSLATKLKSIVLRSFGLTDSAALRQSFASVSNAANKNVTVNSAMQLATVWACVRLLSETVGTLPFMLYQTDANGGRTLATADPLYRIIHDSPNADYTAVEFWEGVVLCLALWGNAYARKEFIGRRLVALTPLRCDLMDVRRNSAGQRVYRYSDPRGATEYSEDEIFHVRGFGGAGDMGLSPVSFARQSLGTAMAADEFAGTMFANGMRPNAILTVDQVLKDPQRKQVQENIVKPYLGSENAGGVMVLEAGMKFQAVTMTPEDSQFLETRAFHVEEICRWFRVPPFMVGHTEKTTSWGTGLEQQLIGFLTFSLRPYLSRIEQAVSRALIPPAQRSNLKPEFKVEGLLRTDSAARASFYSVMVTNGIMTRNEVRRLENLPPLDGGDELTVQSQNVPLSEIEKLLHPPAKVPAAA